MFRLNLSLTLIVPALRVGMALWMLRVRDGMTRSVRGCVTTQSVGTIKSSSLCTCGSELARE
jgi:hypothetical protein